MTRDPLGRSGDFTTAPEISQMFGEMIGAWLADIWIQHGKPTPFILLELGPGRGTLMADIIRICTPIFGFVEAAEVHLVEISPALKEMQRTYLHGISVEWHENLNTLPNDKPIFFIANEFFDALPFKQYIYESGKWAERCIDVHDGVFGYKQQLTKIDPGEGGNLPLPEQGSIYEDPSIRTEFMKVLGMRVKAQKGAGLIIDYGHFKHGYGDTFQALKGHKYSDPLENIGESDLTSHVDFSALKAAAEGENLEVLGMKRQGEFLLGLGIQLRATQLLQKASGEAAQDVQKALHRLVHSDEMGSLFKVIGLNYGASVTTAGF
jgi:NADH dehydrogenase [ubiquinone] 1 alpha subcomplex assembly factor 7